MRQTHPVIPVTTWSTQMQFEPPVGRAASLTEARRRMREAGYRIMWSGGTHGLSPAEAVGLDEDAWTVTVWPARRSRRSRPASRAALGGIIEEAP